MKRTLLLAALIATSLTACTTITPEERRRGDEARCRSYGFRPGTDAFAQCLLDVDLDRAAARRYNLQQAMGPGWGPYWGRPWYW